MLLGIREPTSLLYCGCLQQCPTFSKLQFSEKQGLSENSGILQSLPRPGHRCRTCISLLDCEMLVSRVLNVALAMQYVQIRLYFFCGQLTAQKLLRIQKEQ